MAVNLKSEQGQALRKLFPMATMPAQQFKELCADCDVSKMPKGSFYLIEVIRQMRLFILSGDSFSRGR